MSSWTTLPPPRGRGPGRSSGDPRPGIDPSRVGRVVLCSGKIAFDAMRWRERLMTGLGSRTGRLPPSSASSSSTRGPNQSFRSVLDRYPGCQ